MQIRTRFTGTLVIFCFSAGMAMNVRAQQGTAPAGVSPPAAQSVDPLDGRWAGTVKNPQGQQMPVIIFFKKGEAGYSGSITDFAPSRPMIPFQEIRFDGKSAVEVKYSFTPPNGQNTAVEIRFSMTGEALQGNATVSVGTGAPVPLTYELKREEEVFAPKTPVPVPQLDMEDYARIREEKDPAAKKKLIDVFAQKYPQSKALAFVYQEGAILGRISNDVDVMGDYGEKSLAVWPDNYVLMTELGSAYVQRRQVDKAEEKANKALELISTAPKPESASEEQWAEARSVLTATNQCTLGFVHLNRAQGTTDAAKKKIEAEAALEPFRKALELIPKDDYSLYGIGITYATLNDYANSESYLARASVVNGTISAIARSTLETLYKSQHQDSVEGLDKVLAKAKADLGISQ